VYSIFTPSHRGGSGSPLVCLHGFTGTWRTWELVLPALERHHDVLTPTLLGHAGGPPLEGEVSADVVLGAIELAMEDAGFATAHIVGNSLGGYLALRLAARGRAASVVALAPAGGWARGDESYKETLVLHATMQEQLKAAAPHAEAIVASVEGRRMATQLVATNFEHIPRELLVHHMLGTASCKAVRPMIEYAIREGGADRLPGADRVGHGRQAPAMAVYRRPLPRRLAAARRLGRARRRRPLPTARRPAGDRAAHPGIHRTLRYQ
jgi:pimeloyl-ACP methyl ester carboxylesterase